MPKPNKKQLMILLVTAVLCFGAGALYGRAAQTNEQAAAALLTPLPQADPALTAPPALSDEPAGEPDAQEQEPPVVTVHVKGAVERPGLYSLPEGSRVSDALDTAGLLAETNTDIINLAAPLADGLEVIAPFRVEGETTDWQALAQNTGLGAAAATESAPAEVVSGPVNINSASLTALQSLSGIGPAKAQAIIDYRQEHGPFQRVEDIKKVSGIGDATYNKIKSAICVE